ncbi:MAG: hypothetical protein B7X81_11720 [Hydrogenophilales bacterium 17-61-76]|nr:MAG: hypothetical protein B7X81_11720 [Hydrogenophilales bacterium 17-61-76]
MLPACRQFGTTTVRQLVQHKAREIGAADPVGQRDFVDTTPYDGLRAQRQPRVAAAVAHVGVGVVGRQVGEIRNAAPLLGAVHPRASTQFPVTARLPQHKGLGAKCGIAVGLGGVGQAAQFQQQVVDTILERWLEAACASGSGPGWRQVICRVECGGSFGCGSRARLARRRARRRQVVGATGFSRAGRWQVVGSQCVSRKCRQGGKGQR